MWVAKRRALLNVWLGRIAKLLEVDSTYAEKLWIPQFCGRFFSTGRNYAPYCVQNELEVVGADCCPELFMIEPEEEDHLRSRVQAPNNTFSRLLWRRMCWQRQYSWCVWLFRGYQNLLGMAISRMQGPAGKRCPAFAILPTPSRRISTWMTESLSTTALHFQTDPVWCRHLMIRKC